MKWKNLKNEYVNALTEFEGKTPHEILRVSANASVEEIKRAYRRLVRAYHPDTSDEFMRDTNQEIMKRITLAYRQTLRRKNAK